MSRLDEIRQRTEAAKAQKEKGDSITAACIAWSIVINDVPYLLEEVKQARAERDHIKLSNDGLCVSHDNLYARLREATARAEKAEAERDTYKAALQKLEYMISNEKSGNRKREHSIGVCAAAARARELLKGE